MIDNINFTFSDNAIAFDYNINEKAGFSAYLQLPDVGDSQHVINDVDYEDDNQEHVEIFDALADYYFSFFKDVECAAASALLEDYVNDVVEIDGFYVAFTDDKSVVIKESAYRSYYNKAALFDLVSYSDLQIGECEFLDENDIVAKAREYIK